MADRGASSRAALTSATLVTWPPHASGGTSMPIRILPENRDR